MKLWLCVIILALLAGAAFADPLPEFRLPDETTNTIIAPRATTTGLVP